MTADRAQAYSVDGRPVPAPRQATIVDDLLRWARIQPERPFLTWVPATGSAEVLSYGALERRSRALARVLAGDPQDQAPPVASGSAEPRPAGGPVKARPAGGPAEARPVALLADNSLPCVLAVVALLRAGVPCLFLNPRDPHARVRAILAEHPVAAVYASAVSAAVDSGLARPIPATADPADDPSAEPACDPSAEPACDPSAEPADDPSADSTADPAGMADRPTPADATALIFATSGSTAASKLVLQPHRALTSNAEAVRLHHRLHPGMTLMGGLPIHHVNGVHFTLMAPLHAGAHVVLPQELSPFSYRRLLEDHQPDIASVVPPVLESLLVAGRGWRPPPSLRYFVSAAAPLTASLLRRVVSQLGVRVLQGYGLTETTNFSTTVPVDVSDETYRVVALEAPIPSIGVAMPGNEVQILSPDGAVLGERQHGELCMRGHNVMAGYAGRPDLTARAFQGGWFHSGDIGYWESGPDGRRYFYITGRSKNIAKVRGEAVSLEELERALLAMDSVADAGCVALPHPLWGEQVAALVVTAGDDADLEQIRSGLAAQVPAVAVPSRWRRVSRIPRTATGKLQRPQLAQFLEGELA